jgi:nitrogenase molybdenum-iron protein NifN
MRRYLISHFREPVDIASSSLSESTAVFGGGENLIKGIHNVMAQYWPEFIGVATTCLSETVGEDVPAFLRQVRSQLGNSSGAPALVHVATPSFRGTHVDGFHAAVLGMVESLAGGGNGIEGHVNLFPNMVSPADLRHLKELLRDFGLRGVTLPDYSDTLDAPAWEDYRPLADGGTSVEEIRAMHRGRASIEFTSVLRERVTAARLLESRFSVPATQMPLPIGLAATDDLVKRLCALSGKAVPAQHVQERGRLLDAYADAHKYVFGLRVVLYGEEDFVTALAGWCAEIGALPVLVASGGKSGRLESEVHAAVARHLPEFSKPVVRQGVDFVELGEDAAAVAPDLFMGNSKGYSIARPLNRPLVRVGFPIHDRFGGQRVLHVGYRGAQQLLDTLVNTILQRRQDDSPVGYSYQ